jgi:hypothetical protein
MSARSRWLSALPCALLTSAALFGCGASAEENPPPPPPPPVDQAAFQKPPRPPAGTASIALPDGGMPLVAADYWRGDGGDEIDAAPEPADAAADAAPDASTKRRGARTPRAR